MADQIDFNTMRLGAEGDYAPQAKPKKAASTKGTTSTVFGGDYNFNQALADARKALTEATKSEAEAQAGLYGPESTGKFPKTFQTGNNNQGTDNTNDWFKQWLLQQDANAKLKAEQDAKIAAQEKARQGQSAYDLLLSQFQQYGLGALVEPLKGFIVEGLSPAEFTIKLRDTDAYKKRFAANAQRIAKGLRALSEAEYIGLEDQYQNVMRNYGLPASYYERGDMGRQQGFEKFIGGDVSAAELEDRIQTAQNRVINAAPEVSRALRQFYPDISNGDILAYALDPEQALTNIKRKVTAAEIGGAAMAEGLTTELARAEELQRFGVTGAAYRQAAPYIKQAAERGSQLTGFYGQGQFDQTTAEQAVLGISGSSEAQKKIRKLTELEQASFGGRSGAAGGALGRERAGQF